MRIKKILLTIMGVACIGLSGISTVGCSTSKEDSSTLKGAYLNVIEKYANDDVVNSNELIKTLSEAKLERSSSSVLSESHEDDGYQKDYPTSKYKFKKDNEVLGVEYLGDDTKEAGMENLESAYYAILKDGSEDIYLNMYYSKSMDNRLSMEMYLDSVEEQKELVNLINDNKEISNMYEVYYKLAQSIENGSSISISDIEKLLGNKKLKKFEDYYKSENTNLESYTYSQDGLNMNIVYDGKENKCYEVLLEDIELQEISLTYYKDLSKGITLYKRNVDYKEQESILSKLMKIIDLTNNK